MVEKAEKEKRSGKQKVLHGHAELFVRGTALAMVAFQLYTTATVPLTPMLQRGIHLAFASVLIFFIYPIRKGTSPLKTPFYDVFFGFLAVVLCLYAAANYADPDLAKIADPPLLDQVFGILAIVLVLELVRRVAGLALGILCLVGIAYLFVGPYLPYGFGHTGVSLRTLVVMNYMRLDGLFGMTTGVSATIAFSFILFSTVLFELGGGDAFLKLAQGLVGQFRGGPAKIAILASCLFGTISGVSSANVASTGSFTIPMMKKMGYRAHFAGAVESVASTGGQLMPPVMGVAAFVMVEFLEISYWKLCIYAIFPAVLYYLAVFVMADLEARKLGLEGIPKDQLPRLFKVLKESWEVVIPAAVLIFLIGYMEASPSRAAFWSIVVTLALHLLNKIRCKKKLEWTKIIRAFEMGARRAIMIAAICAAVGIVMGIVNMSGLGLKLSGLLIDLSLGKLPLLLFYTMIASMVLGMGLPSLPAYIILAVLAAPSLIEMGVNKIAAHLFVYYYGMISSITPPVAIASFVAAGIADSPAMKTAWTSTRLGIAAYILPFMFVYSHSLLLMGDLHEIVLPLITSCIGIFALALASEGYFLRKISWSWRGLLLCSALFLIYPSLFADSFGFGIIGIFLVSQKLLRKNIAAA